MKHSSTIRILSLALITFLLAGSFVVFLPRPAEALSGNDFNAGRIIDDSVFFDSNRMNAFGIQAFLSSKVPACDNWGTQPYAGTTRRAYSEARGVSFPLTCLKDYRQNVPHTAADQYCSGTIGGGNKSAAQIIKDVADACSVNPMALLVLLQKEQSLVTDDWPWPVQFQKATGFGCPDTAPCDSQYYGFFNQVYRAARQFHRYSQDSHLFNYRTGRTNLIQYHPNVGCGHQSVFIQNQATAGLYNYTPYVPNQPARNNLGGLGDSCSSYGNLNFWRIYNDWFGSPITDKCYGGASGLSVNVLYHKQQRNKDNPDFLIYSGASTDCLESHIWNSGESSWMSHTASVQPSFDYPNAQLMFGDLDGDGRDYPVIFGLAGTSSGKIESHVLNRDWKRFLAHGESNRATVDPGDMNIRLADLNGDGRDEPILVAYRNTGSGKVEFHGWAPGMKSWAYHIATNQPAIDPADHIIEFADLNGDGRDEAVLIALRNTGSGKVEFHVWAPGQAAWQAHIASNQLGVNPLDARVQFADIDANGTDEAVLIGTRNTGSGRIEFHTWRQGLTSWRWHVASNQSTIQ